MKKLAFFPRAVFCFLLSPAEMFRREYKDRRGPVIKDYDPG